MRKSIKSKQSIGGCNCKSDQSEIAGLVSGGSSAAVLTNSRNEKSTQSGELLFKPYFVQDGIGPHIGDWAFASDKNGDTFRSNATVDSDGLKISDSDGKKRFGINVRWNVEGFGYNDYTADNNGELYELPPAGKQVVCNLNYEIAHSRVDRNRKRRNQFEKEGWRPSKETTAYLDLSEGLLEDAGRKQRLSEDCGKLAQRALYYALWGSEMMEMDKINWAIGRQGHRSDFLFGCDARSYHEMSKDRFMELFPQLFNFAALTFVVNGDSEMNVFEPVEGQLNFSLRDVLFNDLWKHDIKVEGRLLFWFHKWVTPEWLARKNYDQLKKYIEQHTREVMSHYGDRMHVWEVVNEFHDWANEVQLNPDQIVELTKFACEVARDTVPAVPLMINNCCPFGEYVHLGNWSGQKARYQQRTPWQFIRDLVDAGVDFDIIGQQYYYQYRDLQDYIVNLERFETFGKTVQISEIGATSGPSDRSVKTGSLGMPTEPYAWRRPWDEDLQADWAEAMYLIGYSKPWVDSVLWFDFIDDGAYYDNGGLLRWRGKQIKASFNRLAQLRQRLDSLEKK